jgi:hypothetical protein
MRWGSGSPWATHFSRSVESAGSCHNLPAGMWLVSVRRGADPPLLPPPAECNSFFQVATSVSVSSCPMIVSDDDGGSVALALGSVKRSQKKTKEINNNSLTIQQSANESFVVCCSLSLSQSCQTASATATILKSLKKYDHNDGQRAKTRTWTLSYSNSLLEWPVFLVQNLKKKKKTAEAISFF